jgi:hypothetical protein
MSEPRNAREAMQFMKDGSRETADALAGLARVFPENVELAEIAALADQLARRLDALDIVERDA